MTPAPTPQPAHDHGAAGFCTNHAQPAPDERVETVARVLAEHWPYYDRCRCQWRATGDVAMTAIDHRKHMAAAVVAALDDETARLRVGALRDAADALVGFAEETYPRDIFIEPSREDYAEINALLDRERGHMLDGVAADCYRRALAVGARELRDLAAALDPEEPR